VRSLSQKDVDRSGLKVETSEGRVLEKTVQIGGRDVTVTGFKTGTLGKDGKEGVYWTEPGWDYNPGKTKFVPDLKKYDQDIAAQFKKVQDKYFEVPKYEPLLKRLPVKSSKDIEPLLAQYSKENPDVFQYGFKNVQFPNSKKFLMATDTRGSIKISTAKSPSGMNPKADLTAALKKLSTGQELSFTEEYSIESLWHVILHNRATGQQYVSQFSIQHITMETLNQFVARHTYTEFLEKLGGKPAHASRILKEGIGYRYRVENFRSLLQELKIDEAAILGRLRNISFTSKWRDIPIDVSKELGAYSRIESAKIERCLAVLRSKSGSGFIEAVRQILK